MVILVERLNYYFYAFNAGNGLESYDVDAGNVCAPVRIGLYCNCFGAGYVPLENGGLQKTRQHIYMIMLQ
jgi:hypothetical protein